MKVYMIVEISEIDDVESQEADNALMIITDAMQHFPYPYYIDEVTADEV
jgi:formylmethanofuran dehydrogenase subunit B